MLVKQIVIKKYNYILYFGGDSKLNSIEIESYSNVINYYLAMTNPFGKNNPFSPQPNNLFQPPNNSNKPEASHIFHKPNDKLTSIFNQSSINNNAVANQRPQPSQPSQNITNIFQNSNIPGTSADKNKTNQIASNMST